MRAVLSRGTTTHAAELMGLTQSAVSRLITQLEQELGFNLFDRRHGRLLITPEGQQFYTVAEKVLAGIDQISATARDIQTLGTGTLRIIAMPALGYGMLPETIAQVKRNYPQVKISVDLGNRQEIEKGIANAQYDFGLATLPIEHESIDIEPLCGVDAVCVTPQDHPLAEKKIISAHDLEDQPFISVEPGGLFRYRTDELFGRLGIRRKLGIEAKSTVMVCSLVSAGIGASIVHPFIADSVGAKVAVRRFEPAIRFEYGLLFPTGVTRSQMSQAFIQTLRAAVATIGGDTPSINYSGLG